MFSSGGCISVSSVLVLGFSGVPLMRLILSCDHLSDFGRLRSDRTFTTFPSVVAMMASPLAAVESDAPARVHREKEAAVGDQLNPHHCMAQLRSQANNGETLANMPREQAAVDA